MKTKLKKLVTRPCNLFIISLANFAYQNMPIYGVKEYIMVGKEGIYTNYTPESEIETLLSQIRNNPNKIKKEINKAKKIDTDLKKIIKKPIEKNYEEFLKLYKEGWKYEIFGYYIGVAVDEKDMKSYRKDLNYFRGHTSAMHSIAVDYLPKFYAFMSKKFGVKKSLAEYITYEEVLSGKINKKELEKREKLYTISVKDKKSTFAVGSKAKIIEKKLPKEKVPKTSELKGLCAQKGKVRGKAKIINKIKDLDKVKEGDVLIAPATITKFLPAMKKSSAIVTNEGGITSHAAIISRELKIPCIIGTKFATKVFKDGDYIEVDATNGIVKKVANTQSPYQFMWGQKQSIMIVKVQFQNMASKANYMYQGIPEHMSVTEDGVYANYLTKEASTNWC